MASCHHPAPEDGISRNCAITYLTDEYPLFSLDQLGFDCRVEVVAVKETVEILVENCLARAFASTSGEDSAGRLALIRRQGCYNRFELPWQNLGKGNFRTLDNISYTTLSNPALPDTVEATAGRVVAPARSFNLSPYRRILLFRLSSVHCGSSFFTS